jgi:hypothetical protein
MMASDMTQTGAARSDLIVEMGRRMNDANDYDTTREQFAEAAVEVLVKHGVVSFPEDRVDLMFDITDAMSATDTPDNEYPETWHRYAEAILNIFQSRGLLRL